MDGIGFMGDAWWNCIKTQHIYIVVSTEKMKEHTSVADCDQSDQILLVRLQLHCEQEPS